MLTKAVARYIRLSPTKGRLVADLIRGKSVGEALSILQYSPQHAARLIEKVLRSAVANAEHNHQVRSFEDLRVGALIDGGPVLKRIQPRAMGRAFHIRHRTSHITITLMEPSDGRPRGGPRPGGGRRAAARPETAGGAAPEKAAQKPTAKPARKAGDRPAGKPRAKGSSTRSA
jgi:large subunit ribosomal protein L22